MKRITIRTGAPWESMVGYCRAVRVGPHISVSGTAPVGEDGEVVGVGDAYLQARRCIEIIEKALAEAGAGLGDVVRTRMFVTDISRSDEYGRAHGEFFRDIRPASTMVEVSRLIDPAMMIEIEVDAVKGGDPGRGDLGTGY